MMRPPGWSYALLLIPFLLMSLLVMRMGDHEAEMDDRVNRLHLSVKAASSAIHSLEALSANVAASSKAITSTAESLRSLILNLQNTSTFLANQSVRLAEEERQRRIEEQSKPLMLPTPAKHDMESTANQCWPNVLETWGLRRFYDFFFEQHAQSAPYDLYAVKETAQDMDNDRWFWTDDNAKAMELFALPGARHDYSHMARRMYDFIMQMTTPNGMIFRRMMVDRLTVLKDDPAEFHVESGFLRITGNLENGFIKLSHRFHDGREVVALQIRVRLGGEAKDLPKECALFLSGAEPNSSTIAVSANELKLTHVSPAYSMCNPSVPVGHIRFQTSMHYGRSYFTHSCEYVPDKSQTTPNTEGIQCVVSIHSSSTVRYSKAFFAFRARSGKMVYRRTSVPCSHRRFSWVLFAENKIPAFSYAFVLVPEQTSEYALTYVGEGGELSCLSCHGPLSFTTVLVSGGVYGQMESYQYIVDHLNDDRLMFKDLSVSYDYGAEMNGVAALFASEAWSCEMASAGNVSTKEKMGISQKNHFYNEHTINWFNSVLNAYEHGLGGAYFHRGVAFTVLALDTMFSVTNNALYRAKQVSYARMLMAFNDNNLDELAAVALALARSAITLQEMGLAHHAVALLSKLEIKSNTRTQDDEGESCGDLSASANCFPPNMKNYIATDKGDTMFWAFKAGLLSRASRLLLFMNVKGLISIPPPQLLKVTRIYDLSIQYINTVTQRSRSKSEILTSWRSEETNSETQPWCILGLAGVDVFYAMKGKGVPPNPNIQASAERTE